MWYKIDFRILGILESFAYLEVFRVKRVRRFEFS